jgi:hypothetical protein
MPLGADLRFVTLSEPRDLEACDTEILRQLDERSGWGAAATIERQGRLYALISGREVLSQLNIEFDISVINTPSDLSLEVESDVAFLSFLSTTPHVRRGGWARMLIELTCSRLAGEGRKGCICHVQATNLRSKNAFESIGWRRAGWLASIANNRWIVALPSRFGRRFGFVPHVKRLSTR